METTKSSRASAWLTVVISGLILVGGALWGAALLPKNRPGPTQAVTGGDLRSGTASTAETLPAVQILGVWNGRLARFAGESDRPAEVYDVPVLSLPVEEQERLAAGIRVETEEQLAALLEDYTF